MVRQRVEAAVAYIRDQSKLAPRVGLVLGSGLEPLAQSVTIEAEIPTKEIPGYPRSTVEGHAGRILLGTLSGEAVCVSKGRVHSYEGYSLAETTIPIRVMAGLGVGTLVLTNSAGGIRRHFRPGDVMLIEDHLNLQGRSPLDGPNVDDWGPRFPDMSEVYDVELRHIALRTAGMSDQIRLERGIYASCPGPQYETPAEVRMLEALGADAVGMSTVPEAIVARHMGMRVVAFSVISNMASGLSDGPLSHKEVVETGDRIGAALTRYLLDLIPALSS